MAGKNKNTERHMGRTTLDPALNLNLPLDKL